MAIADLRPPGFQYEVSIAQLDGSNRIQLADGDPYIVTIPAWSPDGNWPIASVHYPNASNQPNPALALVLVDACHIIPLPNLHGDVFSWQP